MAAKDRCLVGPLKQQVRKSKRLQMDSISYQALDSFGLGPRLMSLSRSPSSALLCPFLGEGSPTKIDYRKKSGTLILTSLLEDLVVLRFPLSKSYSMAGLATILLCCPSLHLQGVFDLLLFEWERPVKTGQCWVAYPTCRSTRNWLPLQTGLCLESTQITSP